MPESGGIDRVDGDVGPLRRHEQVPDLQVHVPQVPRRVVAVREALANPDVLDVHRDAFADEQQGLALVRQVGQVVGDRRERAGQRLVNESIPEGDGTSRLVAEPVCIPPWYLDGLVQEGPVGREVLAGELVEREDHGGEIARPQAVDELIGDLPGQRNHRRAKRTPIAVGTHRPSR